MPTNYDTWLESGPGGPFDNSDCVGTCPTCNGKGEIIDYDCFYGNLEVVDCPECSGTGVVAG